MSADDHHHAQRHRYDLFSKRLRTDLKEVDSTVHPQFLYDAASQYGVLQVTIQQVIIHFVFHPSERSHLVYPFCPPEIRCVKGSEWLPSSLLRRYSDGTTVVDVDLLRDWTPTILLKTLVANLKEIVPVVETQLSHCGIRKRCSDEDEDSNSTMSRHKRMCYGLK